MSERLIIVGGGLGATTLVEEARKQGVDDAITIVSDETHLPYDRPPLSKSVLTGQDDTVDSCMLRSATWAAEMQVDLILGDAASGLDMSARRLELRSGARPHFDRLVVATGARARVLEAAPPSDRVRYLRDWADAQALRQLVDEHPRGRLLVIGAGFIGLEVVASLRERGLDAVGVVEAGSRPLARVLPDELAELCWQPYQDAQIPLYTSTVLQGIEPTADGLVATLSDGRRIGCDIVVVATGSVPNTGWAPDLLRSADGAILCDGSGRSSADDIWAAGDAAAWPNPYVGAHRRIEHWQAAIDQAAVVAADLAGRNPEPWDSAPYFWSDLLGGRVQLVGEAPANATTRLATDGDRAVAVVRLGDTVSGVFARRRPRAMIAGRELLNTNMSESESQDWCDRTAGVTRRAEQERESNV